ncbi:MAG: M28 family peptidase [Oscillospiraceae bacterium]|nr:M28 family peptidase [Oscillospiraceae bacterium]
MDAKEIMKIFEETAYVRTGGSPEELRTAQYLRDKCAEMGLTATIEPFDVDMATIRKAQLFVDGKEVPCEGMLNSGCGDIEAPIYYLRNADPYSLSLCKGKIVLLDQPLSYHYQDLLDNGALALIKYTGDANYADRDIDRQELRSYVSKGNKIPCVTINVKDAIEIVRDDAVSARIVLEQEEYTGQSHNVILDLPGEIPEYIVLTAHYDSTYLSLGAYDNMSGSVGILGVAEYFAKNPHRYGLRFIWCGSEERGLLGAKAYCAAHTEELKNAVLNINLDMIGCIMGKFIACCSTEEALVHYINYICSEMGFSIAARQEIYSSDSTPFAYNGVPALSFARIAPHNTATIHNRFDTIAVMKGEQMVQDIDFIITFTDRMANAKRCPVGREIPENIKEKLDAYINNKKPKN